MRKRALASILAASALVALNGCGDGAASSNSRNQAPSPSTAQPPWPAPTDVAERVDAAGLDLGPMGMAEHYHPQVRIVVDARPVPVPANIGVDPVSGAMSALHTHEPDGTLHVEADTAGEVFTLGQFFTQWGVTFTRNRIGGVKLETGKHLTVTNNGAPVSGDPQDMQLEPQQRIVITAP